jgi:hypothetical protein
MHLGVVQILPRIFWIFLEFILIFLELFLFIRRLYNLFHELKTLYLDSSCPNVSLGIFLEFLGFSEYFSCLVSIFWNFRICFCAGKYFEKKKKTFLSSWAEPVGPTQPTRAQPRARPGPSARGRGLYGRPPPPGLALACVPRKSSVPLKATELRTRAP